MTTRSWWWSITRTSPSCRRPRGDVTLLTHFDDSTVVVDYPSWSADGRRIEFSLTRKVGDLFLLENPAQ